MTTTAFFNLRDGSLLGVRAPGDDTVTLLVWSSPSAEKHEIGHGAVTLRCTDVLELASHLQHQLCSSPQAAQYLPA